MDFEKYVTAEARDEAKCYMYKRADGSAKLGEIFLRDEKSIEKTFGWIIFTVLLAADRATKFLAVSYLSEAVAQESVRFFSLSLYRNQGISFSLLGGFPAASLTASILGITVLGWLCLKNELFRSSKGVLFLWAGALGNFIDRLLYGYVIDWFYVGVYINLADIWLCAGCLMIFHRCVKA